jgi:cell division protein FtsN
VLALLVLAMFAGFVWLAYSEGVARGRSEIPVVTAEAGPARVAPANPGGASTPYKGFKIYEQPAPPDEDTAQDVSPKTPAEAKASPAPAIAAPAAAPPKPAPAAKVEAPPAKPAAPPVKTAPAVPTPKPAPIAKAIAPAKPSAPAAAPPKQVAANAAPAPMAQAPDASGAYVLQIGAYKSQGEADAAWTAYKAKHGALLADYSPNVARADLGDKGTWYRLRIAGFSSKDVASALCDRLKADGGGCFLGK